MTVSRFEDVVSKDSDMPLNRRELLTAARRILDEALERLDNRYTKNPEKIKWSRVAVHAISVANSVLGDCDLEELQERVKELEALLKP